jgi:hypothetical protein
MIRFVIPVVAATILLAALILDTEAVLRLVAAMLWGSGYVGLAIALVALAGVGLAAIRWKRRPAKRPGAGRVRAGRRPAGARVSTRKSGPSRRRSPSRVRPR